MKLIVGLGNPGAQYDHSRHNVGFWFVDAFAVEHDATFAAKTKFKAAVAELTLGHEKILIMKPTTYYNLSGEAVRSVTDFYKLTAEDVLIIHDELALPIGQVRARLGGSDAGNNGIKSITTHIGANTARLRIGTCGESYKAGRDSDYVLNPFSKTEFEILERLRPTLFHFIDDFIRGELLPTTHRTTPPTDNDVVE